MDFLRDLIRRNPLPSFVVLTFTMCWGIGALINGTPLLAPNGNFILGVPIAALFVIAMTSGRAGLKDLGRRALLWRVGLRWYLIVFGLPVLVVGLILILLPIVGAAPFDWSKMPPLVTLFAFTGLLMVLPLGTPVAEEIGWRGFALPNLLQTRSALTASLILGVIWSAWHLPVVLSDPVVRVPVPFMLAVIPLSILTTWIFVNTRSSLFIAILFHAWFDAFLAFGLAVVAPADAALIWWLLAGIQTVMAIAVVAAYGPTLMRRPAASPATAAAAVAEA